MNESNGIANHRSYISKYVTAESHASGFEEERAIELISG